MKLCRLLIVYLIIHSPQCYSGIICNAGRGTYQTAYSSVHPEALKGCVMMLLCGCEFWDRPPHRGLRSVRLIYEECVRSLTYHWIYYISGKACEAGSTVYCPFPRKSESLTVCRCYYESSTFSSVILRSWVLIWPGFEPPVCLSTDRCMLILLS